MIELVEVKTKDRMLLWNIHQKYLYEMTRFYPGEMDEQGNYHYGYFDAYFTEPERKALFIMCDGVLVGFAMIASHSYLGETPDHVLAEFTVFPAYRKKHIATTVAEMIFSQNRGQWEVKFNEANTVAKKLWEQVSAVYHPRKICLNEVETVLSFCVK